MKIDIKAIKDSLIIFVVSVAAYATIAIPSLAFDYINRPEYVPVVTEEVDELEPSTASESLSNIPEVTVKWEEVKALAEDSEGSTTASEEDDEAYFDVPLSDELQSHIFEQCETIGLEPEIVIAVIYKESGFRSDVIGDSGRSFGLMQIQPKWYSQRMQELGCNDLLDPFQNITVGIDILRELIESSEDEGRSIEWVLMAYNGGTGYADSLISEGRVSDYATTVLSVSEDISLRDEDEF